MKPESVLIIGLGKYGEHLALQFVKRGLSVMVLTRDEETANRIAPYVSDIQIGDGTNLAVLRTLGVSDFDVCFVTIGEDFQSSLEITSFLKDLGAKYVVSKATNEVQEKLLLKIGADEVVFPERDIAEKTAVRFSSNHILDYIQVAGEYSIFQIPVPAEWTSQTIASLNVRQKYAVNILAVESADGHIDAMPGANYILQSNEKLLILGKSQDVFRLTDQI